MAAVLDVELAKSAAVDFVDRQAALFAETNRTIWRYAEPSLQETQSAELLASLLERNGFAVERGVAGLPTAFVATWGSGGVFDGADTVLAWHPGDKTGADFISTMAMVSVRFTFHGRTSHAAVDPYRGRSALDAVELMNVGVNFMREHVKQDARIHYVI